MDLISKAEKLMYRAHAGDLRKDGSLYVGHPRRVAAAGNAYLVENPDFPLDPFSSPEEFIAFLMLHDAFEDSSKRPHRDTIDPDLISREIAPAVGESVALVTRDVSRTEYLFRFITAPPALVLGKLLDIEDNTASLESLDQVGRNRKVYEHVMFYSRLARDHGLDDVSERIFESLAFFAERNKGNLGGIGVSLRSRKPLVLLRSETA